MKAEVERVEDGADEGDAEIRLEVRAVVPAERGDAVAGMDAEIEEGAGEAAGAFREGGVVVTADRLVGRAPDDLAVAEERFGAAEDGREGERIVHHEAVHAADCMRNASAGRIQKRGRR